MLAGNGVLRRRAADELRAFAKGLHVPVATTFMGKGAMDDRSHLSLMAVGLQARDHVLSGFDRADLVICVGYDLVEYGPSRWNPDGDKRIVHIDTQPAEVDARTGPRWSSSATSTARSAGCSRSSSRRGSAGATRVASATRSREILVHADLRSQLLEDLARVGGRRRLAVKPQKAILELRRAMAPDDMVVSDVGAHKIWVARLFQAYEPNTVIISNGFAAMGIALPGAIAAALVHPDGGSSRCAATAGC